MEAKKTNRLADDIEARVDWFFSLCRRTRVRYRRKYFIEPNGDPSMGMLPHSVISEIYSKHKRFLK